MGTYRLKGASGAFINQSFALGARTVIGRADDCDLRLDQDGVAARHAEISEAEGGLVLSRLDPAGEVLLNGQAVERAGLSSGDEIRIANCRFVLQAPGLRPQTVLTPAAVRPQRRYLPWLIVAALLAAAGGAWYAGLLQFV
jgi:predicted component of type VI protein secretion system